MPPNPSIDIWRRYRPTPSQEKFLRSRAFGRMMVSGYGSGKSKTGCREGIHWALRYPGSRGLIGRLVGDELKTSTMVTFQRELLQVGLREGKHFTHNKSDREYIFTLYDDPQWQSHILYRHLDDVNALGSQEFNWAFIDEGAEVDDAIYKTISSSRLRWHLPVCDQQERVLALIEDGATDEEVAQVPCNCPRGIWVCTNPGGSTYLEEVYYGRVPDWECIRVKAGENPYNGPEYYAKMKRDAEINGPEWMRQYYDGEWGVIMGARFKMFSEERHIMASEFFPTPDYEIVEGWDFGSRETFVVWIAYKPNGIEPAVVFAELQAQNVQEISPVVRAVREIRERYRVSDRVLALGDPAGEAGTAFSAVGPISAYAGAGIIIAPCRAGKKPTDRANHIAKLLNQNKVQPDGSIWAGLLFGPNCPAVVQSLKKLRWKPPTSKIGEDPREAFVKKDDHGVDALGYGLVAVPPPEIEAGAPPIPAGVNVSAKQALAEQGWR